MEYAAIIIPTLNRYGHLKRCVESLLLNDEAKYTDLYVSVDYPPTEKYREGYTEVLDYVKTISGFLSVNIYYQDINLGPGLNRRFLEDKISVAHDRYVFTDDDNEFSKNFLAYVNWGLEYFNDDDSIYAVCSCVDFDIQSTKIKSDYFLIHSYNPFGSGHWLHKNRRCREYLNQKSLNSTYREKEKQDNLLHCSPTMYMYVAQDSLRRISAMRGKNDCITYIDIWENYYIIENSMKCVKPILPKSRNWGKDGSGVHSSSTETEDYIPRVKLDSSSVWASAPKRLDSECEITNAMIYRRPFDIKSTDKIKSKIIYRLNFIVGNENLYNIYKFLKKVYRKIRRKNSNETEVKYG